jgi:hypothetical protein
MGHRNKESLVDDEVMQIHADRLSMFQVILKIIEVVMMKMMI